MLDSLCLFTLFPAFRRILFAHDSESSSPVKTMPTTRGQAKRHATTAEPATATSSSAEKTTKTARASSSALATATPRKRGRPPKHPKTTLAETATPGDDKMSAVYDDEERVPLLVGEEPPMVARSWAQRNQWIVFALASGACAAFNGVFAKLTTTELTSTLSLAIARLLRLEKAEKVVEIAVRGMFFGLNLVFNGVMWTLFTKALAKGNSTTQVTIMNTSFNFFITAILGFAIFSEALPPLWWLGAAMLVAGNVIVGAKEESSKENVEGGAQDTGSISLSLADDEIANLRASEAVKDDGDDEDVLQDLIVEDEE